MTRIWERVFVIIIMLGVIVLFFRKRVFKQKEIWKKSLSILTKFFGELYVLF